MVRHEHEGRAENDGVEGRVRKLDVQVIEVHQLDGHIGMIFKNFLAGRDVALVDVNANDFGILERVDNAVEGLASGSSNVQNLLGVVLISLSNSLVSSPE